MSVFRWGASCWIGKGSTSESGMYYFNLWFDLNCKWNDMTLDFFQVQCCVFGPVAEFKFIIFIYVMSLPVFFACGIIKMHLIILCSVFFNCQQ